MLNNLGQKPEENVLLLERDKIKFPSLRERLDTEFCNAENESPNSFCKIKNVFCYSCFGAQKPRLSDI